ncbi:MAG: hypothetical protein M3P45_15050 [Acidobacteriota bacterium]|nr:hypothetical protein [Acidobacteriota bacterium]
MRSTPLLVLTLSAALGIVDGGFQPDLVRDSAYNLVGEVGPSTIAEPGKTAATQSFNLSPDGAQLVLLYETWKTQTGSPENTGLWIALWDRSAQKITKQVHLAENDLPPPAHNSDPRGPIFNENYLYMLRLRRDLVISANQSFVLVMALGRVWVLDARSYSTVCTINSPDSAPAAPVQIQDVGKSGFAVVFQDGVKHFRVDLFDFPSGKLLAEWPSTVIPDSFSPDGMLAVAPDLDNRNDDGVTSVQLLDGRSGKKIKSIPVGFGFKKSRFGAPTANGSVIGKFLNNQEIVVAPSADRDRSGLRSGNSLEIIDTSQGRVTREITPQKFGPIGVLVVSADRTHFAVESVEAGKHWISTESLNPKHYTHKAMVFASKSGAMEAAIPISSARAGGNVSLRISADASTLAMRIGEAAQILSVK